MISPNAYYDDLQTLVGYFSNPGQKVVSASGRAAQFLNLSISKEAEAPANIYVAIDVVSNSPDIQLFLESLHEKIGTEGRVLLTAYNIYLRPFFRLGEILGLKKSEKVQNWLSCADVQNFCELSGFEIIRSGARCIIPWRLLGFGTWLNRWLGPLPIFKLTNLYGYFLLRPKQVELRKIDSVSVIVPARNEEGNIPAAITRLPKLAERVELIFVEGNSTDNTWAAIQNELTKTTPNWLSLSAYKQSGKGKANAVHLGFEKAKSDLLMVLDADLTVPPEELPRFIKPIIEGSADFTHGSRLVYPMEGEAMRFLNILGNKFFSFAFTFVLGQRFKDTLCGTKVLFKSDWERILALRSFFGDFDPFGDYEMLFGSTKLNHKILEIPIHYKARTYGETNISRFTHGIVLLQMVMFAARRMKFLKIAQHQGES